VTWLRTNIPSRAATIPITAPVWAGLQVHHEKAMPSAMKAWTMAVVAADSCLIQPTILSHVIIHMSSLHPAIAVHALLPRRLLPARVRFTRFVIFMRMIPGP
jgi:hypothetical protein